jgi:hypothetical protein
MTLNSINAILRSVSALRTLRWAQFDDRFSDGLG